MLPALRPEACDLQTWIPRTDGFLLAILLSVRRPPAPRWVGTLLRWVEIAGSWSMVEVMMLGILVSLVKIAALARVIPGVGIVVQKYLSEGPTITLSFRAAEGIEAGKTFFKYKDVEIGKVTAGALSPGHAMAVKNLGTRRECPDSYQHGAPRRSRTVGRVNHRVYFPMDWSLFRNCARSGSGSCALSAAFL